MRLDDIRNIQFVDSAQSILHPELIAHVLPPPQNGNDKGPKMNQKSAFEIGHSASSENPESISINFALD